MTINYFQEYKDKKILITGGAGCVGSNLTKALLKTGPSKIYIVDDLSSGKRWNIPDDEKIEFIQGSILDDEILKRVFSKKLDYVFHLAAHFANQNSVDHPETDLLVNGLGTLKLLEYSQLSGVKKFIFASSGCSVYGSQAPLPLKEDFVSLHLDTPYQITKLLGELYCNFFYRHYGLPIVNARLFNVYGPGEVPGKYRNVIPNFIYWALHNKPLPITGTGEETRDFTFVEDIADGLLRAGVIKEAVGEAFNLASETETKIIDLANLINSKIGNSAGVVYISRRDWDKIIRRRASIAKARELIGYNPTTKIEEGLEKTISWFKNNLENIEKSVSF